MINIARIGKMVILFIEKKKFVKSFDTMEEIANILELANNTDEYDSDSLNELISKFQAPKLQAEIEFEKEVEAHNKKVEEMKDIIDFMKEVRDNGHDLFEVRDTSIYLKGVSISIPEFLVRKIAGEKDADKLEAYINFWKLCALNPDPRARQDLFEFLEGGDFSITSSGYFVAYRNVVVKNEGNAELQKFVTDEFLKIKRWKKSPRNYEVWEDIDSNGDQVLKCTTLDKMDSDFGDHIGNLADLYENIAKVSEVEYTDAYTETMSIKIGELVWQDRKKCDGDPQQDCSNGLHVGNKSFLSSGYFGKQGIVVLVNPSKVVAVPKYNKNKMRVCEYFPIGLAEYGEDGKLIEIDVDVFEYEYLNHDLEVIEGLSKLSTLELEELKANNIIPEQIDIKTLKNVVVSLDKASEVVNKRVIKL